MRASPPSERGYYMNPERRCGAILAIAAATFGIWWTQLCGPTAADVGEAAKP